MDLEELELRIAALEALVKRSLKRLSALEDQLKTKPLSSSVIQTHLPSHLPQQASHIMSTEVIPSTIQTSQAEVNSHMVTTSGLISTSAIESSEAQSKSTSCLINQPRTSRSRTVLVSLFPPSRHQISQQPQLQSSQIPLSSKISPMPDMLQPIKIDQDKSTIICKQESCGDTINSK